MIKYIGKRLLLIIPVLACVAVLVFTLMFFVPGDPVKIALGDATSSPEMIAETRARMGLDKPYGQQLLTFLKGIIRLDFGNSYTLGIDVGEELLARFPRSFILAGVSLVFIVVIGVPLGVWCALKAGKIQDKILMVITLILNCGVAGVPGFARMMRANILSLRDAEYIEAAVSTNCTTAQIIMEHVIPNAISPLIVQIAMGIASAGLTASALSFLGFGVVAPTPEWGAMLSTARAYIRAYPHMVFFPGLFIMLTVLSLNLIGDAIRDALDPKLKV